MGTIWNEAFLQIQTKTLERKRSANARPFGSRRNEGKKEEQNNSAVINRIGMPTSLAAKCQMGKRVRDSSLIQWVLSSTGVKTIKQQTSRSCKDLPRTYQRRGTAASPSSQINHFPLPKRSLFETSTKPRTCVFCSSRPPFFIESSCVPFSSFFQKGPI